MNVERPPEGTGAEPEQHVDEFLPLVPRPLPGRRESVIDHARAADVAHLVEATHKCFQLRAETTAYVPLKFYDGPGGRWKLCERLFWMTVREDEHDETGAPLNQFDDYVKGRWVGPIGLHELGRILSERVEWLCPSDKDTDRSIIDNFLRSNVRGLPGHTVRDVFRDVYAYNASDAFKHEKGWGIADMERYKGDTGRGRGFVAVASPGPESSAFALPAEAVAQRFEEEFAAAASRLRRRANDMLDPRSDADARTVPMAPAVILGVAATLECVSRLPNWAWSELVDADRRVGFNRLAIVAHQKFDRDATEESRNKNCERIRTKYLGDTADVFERLQTMFAESGDGGAGI